jgi:hypothetical protein
MDWTQGLRKGAEECLEWLCVCAPVQWVSESSRAYAAVTRVVVTDENASVAAVVAGAGPAPTAPGAHSADSGILLRAAHYFPMHARVAEQAVSPWETTSRAAFGPRSGPVAGRPASAAAPPQAVAPGVAGGPTAGASAPASSGPAGVSVRATATELHA